MRCELGAEGFGIVRRSRQRVAQNFGTIGARYEALELQDFTIEIRVRRDWELAATSQTPQKRTLRKTRYPRFKMVQSGRSLNGKFVIAARLDRDRALSNCR